MYSDLYESSQGLLIAPFVERFEIIKVHEGVFEYVLLKCTMNKDVCKMTCLIGAFIQHLDHFWLGFLGLILGGGVQNWTPDQYF